MTGNMEYFIKQPFYSMELFNKYSHLTVLFDKLYWFWGEDRFGLLYEGLNFNYVYNSDYNTYFIYFDFYLRFNTKVSVTSFHKKYGSKEAFFYSFSGDYSLKHLFFPANSLNSNLNLGLKYVPSTIYLKNYTGFDYFPVDSYDAILNSLFNVKYELSDENLDLSFKYTKFKNLDRGNNMSLFPHISSFNAHWNTVAFNGNMGYIGNSKFPHINFIVASSILPSLPFFINSFLKSTRFTLYKSYLNRFFLGQKLYFCQFNISTYFKNVYFYRHFFKFNLVKVIEFSLKKNLNTYLYLKTFLMNVIALTHKKYLPFLFYFIYYSAMPVSNINLLQEINQSSIFDNKGNVLPLYKGKIPVLTDFFPKTYRQTYFLKRKNIGYLGSKCYNNKFFILNCRYSRNNYFIFYIFNKINFIKYIK